MAVDTQALTIEEFIQRYGENGPFEYVDGGFMPVAPQVSGSGYASGELFAFLRMHVLENNLGQAFIETPFVLTLDRSRWVSGSRVPDVMFYSKQRFEQFKQDYPDWESIPVVGAPDFVAEIVSPTDSFTDVSDKVRRYLDDGVSLVWVVDWRAKTIQAHAGGSNQILTFSTTDTLSADPVIPGFTLALEKYFGV